MCWLKPLSLPRSQNREMEHPALIPGFEGGSEIICKVLKI